MIENENEAIWKLYLFFFSPVFEEFFIYLVHFSLVLSLSLESHFIEYFPPFYHYVFTIPTYFPTSHISYIYFFCILHTHHAFILDPKQNVAELLLL